MMEAIMPGLSDKRSQWITPDWPAPANIKAVSTTRFGGVSDAPFASLNLGTHVADDPHAVQQNRDILRATLQLPTEPLWLEQVHGTEVFCPAVDDDMLSRNDSGAKDSSSNDPNSNDSGVPVADASAVFISKQAAVIMTADCLPVLFCDHAGTRVAAAHAGWRGLCHGVLERTVQRLDCEPAQLMAWLGPAIGPEAFEVGSEVRAAFMAQDAQAESAFKKGQQEGKYLADIYSLARQRLQNMGLEQTYGGGFCTFTDSERFFSYRREAKTGRMASLIWIE